MGKTRVSFVKTLIGFLFVISANLFAEVFNLAPAEIQARLEAPYRDNFIAHIDASFPVPNRRLVDDAQALFPVGQFQMPGIAAFVRQPAPGEEALAAGSVNNAIVVAQKRRVEVGEAALELHDNAAADVAAFFADVENRSHTERQMLRHLLQDVDPGAHGQVWVYTFANPCENVAGDNQNVCCCGYYRQLSMLFPNLQFNIFFQDQALNNDSVASNPEYFENLLRFLQPHMMHFPNHRVLDAPLRLEWRNNLEGQWFLAADIGRKKGFVRMVNTLMRGADCPEIITDNIFNAVYGNARIIYNKINA